jgi:hypothetical protein
MATATGSYRSEVFALALALASRLGGVAISIAIIMYKSLGSPQWSSSRIYLGKARSDRSARICSPLLAQQTDAVVVADNLAEFQDLHRQPAQCLPFLRQLNVLVPYACNWGPLFPASAFLDRR